MAQSPRGSLGPAQSPRGSVGPTSSPTSKGYASPQSASFGGSDELGKELIRRNREIAEVRDNLLRTEDFLTEARARNNELLEKNSLIEAERTRAEGKAAEVEGRCRVLEAAKETATRQLVEERAKFDDATWDLRQKFEQTQAQLQEALSREEEHKEQAKLHADQLLIFESKLEAEGRNTGDARVALTRVESALEEATSRAADAQLRVKELEAELREQGSRASEEIHAKFEEEEAKRLQAEANIEVERTRAEILTKDAAEAKTEIKRLQNQIEELCSKLEESTAAQKKAEDQNVELRSKLEDEAAARKKSEEENEAAERRRKLEEESRAMELGKQTEDNSALVLEAQAARERAETEAAQQREKALKWSAEADELRRRLEAEAGRLDEVRRCSDEVRQLLGETQSQLQDAEARAEAAAPKTAALAESLESQKLQCQALAKELHEVREEKERHVLEKEQDSTTILALRASISSLEADLASARSVAEAAKQQASKEQTLDSECAALRDQLSATQSQLRRQSQVALESESLRGQLDEARKSIVEDVKAKREVEALQGRLGAFEAQIAERDAQIKLEAMRTKELQQKYDILEIAKRSADEEAARIKHQMNFMSSEKDTKDLQKKCDSLEGAKRSAEEEIASANSKVAQMSEILNDALASSAKALQQKAEAHECAEMAKAEIDIVKIERAVETQKLRGALEELRFGIKQQVASGINRSSSFQPAVQPSFQPSRVKAF